MIAAAVCRGVVFRCSISWAPRFVGCNERSAVYDGASVFYSAAVCGLREAQFTTGLQCFTVPLCAGFVARDVAELLEC